jgi:transmembrane sensor
VSWRDGKLVFISTPFEDVVATLSKWRRGKMIVMDKALARRPVSIIVDVRRAGRILENLEDGLPIRVTSYSPWLSLIYPQ